MVKVMDIVEVFGKNISGHPFKKGEQLIVYRVLPRNTFDVCSPKTGDCWTVSIFEIVLSEKNITNMKLMKDAVRATALRLCQANNTVTTLEIKNELRKTHPYFHWIQNSKNGITGVSDFMNELYEDGLFTYNDTGAYRVYSAVATPKVAKTKQKATNASHNVRSISRTKALDLMANNKGHFFTATFIKQNGDERTINCQYMNQTGTGYVMVKETGKMKMGVNPIRQINIQTLRNIRIGGQNYNIRK